MRRGRISSWSPRFAFVRDEATDKDVFLCSLGCDPRQDFLLLRHGDLVSFTVVDDPKHPGRVMAGRVAWVVGTEPSLRAIEWRRKSAIELMERHRAKRFDEAA